MGISKNWATAHLFLVCIFNHFSLFFLNFFLCIGVKHLPAIWETRVQPLGWEDLLEKEMTTHSNILALKTPWMEESGRLQSMGSQRVGHD